MKLKEHKLWPPSWDVAQPRDGREHPNLTSVEFAQQAIIERTAELRDQCGVSLDVKRPIYIESNPIRGTLLLGEDTPKNWELAKNLVNVVERFLDKTIQKLGEAEVSTYLVYQAV